MLTLAGRLYPPINNKFIIDKGNTVKTHQDILVPYKQHQLQLDQYGTGHTLRPMYQAHTLQQLL